MTDAARLFDLTGKVALVTGGSRGLGREMVLAFAHAFGPTVRVNCIMPGPFLAVPGVHGGL